MANDPARVDDELDVVLDGRRHLYHSELGAPVEVARLLGDELGALAIPPEVAERHIAMALDRANLAAARSRRRRFARALAAAAAAAAIVGLPAVASEHALPGQPLYPLKRTIEAGSLAVTFDPCAEARLEMRIAETRIGELDALVARHDHAHLPAAVEAVRSAVVTAQAAVERAMREEGPNGETLALEQRLSTVNGDMTKQLSEVVAIGTGTTPAQAQAIASASSILAAPPTTATPPPTTRPAQSTTPTPTTGSPAPPTTATPPPTTATPPTATPTTATPTTAAPTSSPSTAEPNVPTSLAGENTGGPGTADPTTTP
jgi:Domain of unknown function (DUF5667)